MADMESAEFFKDTDDSITIAVHIFILTVCLRHVREGIPERTDRKQLPAIWRSLALILNGETKGDNTASDVVAVTGKLEGDGIRAAIVTQNTGPVGKSSVERLNVARDITPLLRNMTVSAEEYSFREHAEMTLSLVGRLLIGRKSGEIPLSVALFYFIVTRCDYKTRSRVKHWEKIWSENPFLILQKSVKKSKFVAKDFHFPAKVFQYINSLDPSDPRGAVAGEKLTVRIDEGTAQKWADTALRLYTRIAAHLLDEVVDPGVQEMARKDTQYNSTSVFDLSQAMEALHRMYKCGMIAHLTTSETRELLLSSMNERKDIRKARKGQHVGNEGLGLDITGQGVGIEVGEETDDGDNNDTDSDTESDVDEGVDDEHPTLFTETEFARYIRLLLVPFTVTTSVVNETSAMSRSLQGSELEVYYVLSHRTTITKNCYDLFTKFRDWYSKLHEGQLQKLSFMNREQMDFEGGIVHAEATLMSLAYRKSLLPDKEVKFTIEDHLHWLKNYQVPLGVGRNCCYCCNLLARTLNYQLKESQSTTVLVTPGTHGTIFPWIPPSDLPHSVLLNIRQNLFEVLDEKKKEALQDRSGKSSPTSDMSNDIFMADFRSYAQGIGKRTE